MMKHLWALGAGILALGVTGASAADLGARPITKAPVAAPLAIYDWSGFYIGGHIGGAFADKDWSDPTVFPSGMGSHHAGGFLAGAQAGFNIHVCAWVFGSEGDWSWTNADGEHQCDIGVTCRTELNWLATVTGRVGYAFNTFLLYAKGGVAFVDEDQSVFFSGFPDFFPATASVTRTGWTVGTGLEWAFAPNWSAKIEYDFMDFGTDSINFAVAGLPVGPLEIDQQVHVAKAGINYRFNWGAPVAARY